MTVDVNGVFYEEILWPSGEESQAPSGFKGRPCLFSYEASQKRVFLEGVLPLVSDEAMENVGSVV